MFSTVKHWKNFCWKSILWRNLQNLTSEGVACHPQSLPLSFEKTKVKEVKTLFLSKNSKILLLFFFLQNWPLSCEKEKIENFLFSFRKSWYFFNKFKPTQQKKSLFRNAFLKNSHFFFRLDSTEKLQLSLAWSIRKKVVLLLICLQAVFPLQSVYYLKSDFFKLEKNHFSTKTLSSICMSGFETMLYCRAISYNDTFWKFSLRKKGRDLIPLAGNYFSRFDWEESLVIPNHTICTKVNNQMINFFSGTENIIFYQCDTKRLKIVLRIATVPQLLCNLWDLFFFKKRDTFSIFYLNSWNALFKKKAFF